MLFEGPYYFQNRGFQEANFDVDPSAGFKCDRYSLRCYWSPDSEKSMKHWCNIEENKEAMREAIELVKKSRGRKGAVYIVRAQHRGEEVSALYTLAHKGGGGGLGPAHMCIWKRINEEKTAFM